MALILGLLAAVAGFARITERSWLAPASFFALLWCGYTAASLYFIVDADLLFPALVWIALCVILVYGGTGLSRVLDRRTASGLGLAEWLAPRLNHLRVVTALFAAAGLIVALIAFRRAAPSVADLLSPIWYLGLIAQTRSQFGYGELEQGIPERLLQILAYAAPLFGGLLFGGGRTRTDRALGLVALVSVITATVLYGSRMGILYGGSFWISAFLATRIGWRGGASVVSTRLLVRALAIAVLLLIGLSFAAQIARVGGGAVTALELLLFFADPFAFLAAFAVWFGDHAVQFSDFLFGHRTFWRLYEMLGIHFDPQHAIDVGFTSSNIFTVFRGLIEDFGTIGALVAMLGFGVVSGVAYRAAVRGQWSAVPVLVTVYAAIFVGFSFSLFTYTAPTLALGLLWSFFAFQWLRGFLVTRGGRSGIRPAQGGTDAGREFLG